MPRANPTDRQSGSQFVCGKCGLTLPDVNGFYGWFTFWDNDGGIVFACTPHCMFDIAKARFEYEYGDDKDKDSLLAIAFDLLSALDGFGEDATDDQWRELNNAHERLGVTLKQYEPPDITDYLRRNP